MTALETPQYTLLNLTPEYVEAAAGEVRDRYADLVFDAFPEFYGLLPVSVDRRRSILSKEIGMPGGELENCFGVLREDVEIALVAVIPTENLITAQQASALSLMRALDAADRKEFASRLTGFSSTVEPVRTDGIYLPRLAVVPEARGIGAGTQAMRHIMKHYGSRNYALHVRRDNAPIIRLHSKLGFEFKSDSPYLFRTMVRPQMAG